MIVAIHHLRPPSRRHSSYRSWAKRYADSFCTYQDRHRALMFAIRDPGVSLEDFSRINDEVRTNALELKKLRMGLRTLDAHH